MLFLVFILLSGCRAEAAKVSVSQEFEVACLASFNKSSLDRSQDSNSQIGQKICKCTAKESKNQGATDRELREEAEKIKKNPKYQIANENVMNALRICSIEVIQKED